MNKRCYKRMIHERGYVAEVEIDTVYTDENWSPYLSVDDAYKLDEVRETLRKGDIKAASKLAKIIL